MDEILEGPNYYARIKISRNIVLVALRRQIRYTIYLFDDKSSVAKKIIKGRTHSVDRVLSIVQENV